MLYSVDNKRYDYKTSYPGIGITDIEEELKLLGFNTIIDFIEYMQTKALACIKHSDLMYEEKRKGVTLNISTNCKYHYGIGAYIKGIFRDIRFNMFPI